ncbi:MAG TPA: hypothetical protein VGM25_01280 [Caulobacteraceae bacterium]
MNKNERFVKLAWPGTLAIDAYLRCIDSPKIAPRLKKLVTFRFDPDLLADARQKARRENRSLTNFVETVLRQAIERDASVTEQTSGPNLGTPP